MDTRSTTFADLLARKKKKPLPTVEQKDALPIGAGRQTVPEGTSTIGSLLAELSTIHPDFNIKLLSALEMLSIYNAEVSYAVDNIVQLGNTIGSFPEHVTFDDGVSDTQIKDMLQHLKTKSKKWHKGGINSLVNNLLSQIAVNGALSAESIPSTDLQGVHKVVMVAPKTIRFKFHKEVADYVHYQYVAGSSNTNGIRLNDTTYKYYSLRRATEKPYGIPPFISALENIQISRDMSENLKTVVKKLGLLGFLEVLVNGPTAGNGESDADYFKRTQKYLSQVIPEVEKGMAKGYVVGFKDQHEFNLQPTTGNVQGAKDLIEINDVKLFSGLKQDPLMFGRNFSTTETLARVILAKTTTQVRNYQKIIETYLEDLFLLELQLAGYAIDNIEIYCDPPMIGDQLRDEEAREKKIANLNAEYQQGIISQEVRAQELGREKPDQEEPRPIVVPNIGGGDPKDAGKEDATKTKDKKANTKSETFILRKLTESYELDIGGYSPAYEYTSKGCNCEAHTSLSYASSFDNKVISDFIKKYYKETAANYDSAVVKATKEIGKALAQLGEGANQSRIYDSVMYTLYKNWGNNFTQPQRRTVNEFVKSIYGFFRKDSSVFGAKDGVPNGTFSTVDLRAIEYFKKSDNLYLGKFITDEDLKKKVNKFIKENYLEGDTPIGSNKAAISKFKEEFGDVLKLQEWKISRIINTTVNKMRNTAAVSYMQEAEVESFQIVGVNDRLQCGYCAALQGVTFSVKRALNKIDNMVNSDPSFVSVDSPFVTSVFKKPEDLEGLTGDQLQDKGIDTPPFHSNCRDTIVAIL